ncbi:hypothetical protein V8E36_002259 [Tilletia maclaganii]
MRSSTFTTAIIANILAFFLLFVTAAPIPAPISDAALQSTNATSTPLALSRSTEQQLDARGKTHYGRATWYGQESMGSCGRWHKNSDMIVAISGQAMRSSYCGRTVAVTHAGKTIYATVEDTCPECPRGSLDISRGMFARWASLDVGVLDIAWHFV